MRESEYGLIARRGNYFFFLNQSDCDSCGLILHHTEEDTVCRDTRNTTAGNEMTHLFTLLLPLQLITAVILNTLARREGWGFPLITYKGCHMNRSIHLPRRDPLPFLFTSSHPTNMSACLLGKHRASVWIQAKIVSSTGKR